MKKLVAYRRKKYDNDFSAKSTQIFKISCLMFDYNFLKIFAQARRDFH